MTILVVDDEAPIRSMLQIAFLKAGHEVSTAADGFEATALLMAADFDVLLTDIRMPGMTGHELARFAAANCPEIRTVLMTGYDTTCQQFNAPKCIVISKPFPPLTVLDLLEEDFDPGEDAS